MAVPPRRKIGAAVLALLALVAGAAPASSAQIEDKRAEAATIAAKLQDQARSIVEADKDHRRARDQLAVTDAAVARAEAELASATRRQEDARRLLVLHAQAAYASGGTVTFLGRMARATVDDAAARRTYLRVASGEDRLAIGRLRAAREDLEARRKSLEGARKVAAVQAEATAGDLAQLDRAMNAQRALLAQANGELAQLIAAEQQRRDAEAAQAAAARMAATSTTAPPAPAPAPRPGAVTTAPAAPATTAPPTGETPDSIDETFACIRQLESGNNYKTPGGGAYQFQDATWRSLGYTGKPEDAPPAVQDEAARKLQARDGWKPWTTAPLCGRPV
jgi:peptidoglycan hydrolase CwlO-like protein